MAAELGVDRKRLVRCLEATGTDASEGITFKEGFDALTAKKEREENLARRHRAEAENAEIDNAEKRGDIRRRLELVVKEIAVETRKTIANAGYMPIDHRKRLTADLEEMKFTIPSARK